MKELVQMQTDMISAGLGMGMPLIMAGTGLNTIVSYAAGCDVFPSNLTLPIIAVAQTLAIVGCVSLYLEGYKDGKSNY